MDCCRFNEQMTRIIPSFAGFTAFTPAIPKMYWDVKSQEQRIFGLCKMLNKVICYADMLGENVDEIAKALQEILDGTLDPMIEEAIAQWFEDNEPQIMDAISNLENEYEDLSSRPYQYTFENVEDMKSYDGFEIGDQCETLSYRNRGDNGGNVYVISDTGIDDGGSAIALDNGMYAVTNENLRYVEKWGADNSNTIDSTTYIQNCIDYNKGKSVEFQGGTFKVTEPIYTYYKDDEKVDILGNSSVIAVDEDLLVNIEAILCIGYKDAELTENESGMNWNKIYNITLNGNYNANYGIIINKGFKDARLQGVETLYCQKGMRISEYQSSNPRPSDVSVIDCKFRGNGNLDFGAGIEIYGTDNKFSNVNIARHNPCIDVEVGSQYFTNVHGIVSFGTTTAERENWYQTSFAIVNGNTVTFDYCYADSLHNILDITSKVNGKIEWINGIWLRINNNIGFELFRVDGNPQLIIENNYFDLPNSTKDDPSHQRVGIEFENSLGIQRFNDDRLNISNNYFTNSDKFDYFNSDVIRAAENTQSALFNMAADTWYTIGSIIAALANPINFRIYLLTGYIDVYARTTGTILSPGVTTLQVDKTHAGTYPDLTIGLTPLTSKNNACIGVFAKSTSAGNQILGIAQIGSNSIGVIPSYETLGLALTPSVYSGTPVLTFAAN